ncbi:MAG: hypothetical protein A3F16_07605 [Deltaproteobacteria bacterium RIFCSPHIGHO2_12_FULL_43_9]|nr:MAG: hypothetical protein A3F16_07605 [Deltaproteobacteria bacterium RIFCSPHIGHO2_12_FULL_43_9]
MMGCGKSSVGALLSERLNLQFIDTDSLIEKRTGEGIFKIFSESEERFRNLEQKTICELQSLATPSVIATGGGVVTIDGVPDILRGLGHLIYLKATPVELTKRLINSNIKRPLLDEITTFGLLQQRVETILSSRSALYESSGLTIDTDSLTPGEVCERILSNPLIFP